ncbi:MULTISPECIES: TetR/AcrR family transcriptional regulator [unclassified Aureispira]|uniref:TetR/AcrR family transcriptional regulator n=1 Tax=unclassified Aureispira TaxID=2649989 RepID=UPI000698CF21|nr:MULTISPECIES: TetR/AcrR family transcriptional regulator [unclassified Aureispira]WMX14391.1 TetR/AcrR family transcriptional regulator [Aureispira sp. CCB-E]
MKSKSTPKNTKSKILTTALKLFNELGLPKVTLRSIAKEMGISQGNLCYHFKKREDILEALYLQLVTLMDKEVHQAGLSLPTLASSFQTSKKMMQHFFNYRFFMLDFVQIMRENQTIHSHYKQLSILRQQQFLGMFELWIHEGLMRPEEFKGELHNLYLRSSILGDFWLSAAMVQEDLSMDLVDQYNMILFQNLYPYLTPKGKKQFHEIIE